MERRWRELSDETKQKISQTLRGRGKSSTHRDNISAGLKHYWKQIPNKPTDEYNQ